MKEGEVTKLRYHQADAAGITVSFDKMKRKLQEAPATDWSLAPEQVAEGIELAEAGLSEDVGAWPSYGCNAEHFVVGFVRANSNAICTEDGRFYWHDVR